MIDPVIAIAARGEGRTASGRFVPLASPGDWLDGAGMLHHGPDHEAAKCSHFPACGGCQLQHVSDASYANWMVDRIAGALAGQGLSVPEIRSPHLSPPKSRRRASLTAQRRGKSVLLGFSAAGSHRLVDLKDCAVLDDQLWTLIAPLRSLLGVLIPPRGGGKVQLTLADQGVDALISGAQADSLAVHEAMGDFARQHGLARLSIDQGDGPETQWEPEPATVTLSEVPVALPHAAFLQATLDGESALSAAVVEAVGAANKVADLFAGLGTFTFALARNRSLRAVEASQAALSALRSAANRQQLQVQAEHRDLYRRPLTSTELSDFDAIVLDPPRAGAQEQVAAIAASATPRLAYVSCNPATFARDARVLADGGYMIDWIQPVGQFRWSTHMEIAAQLSRQ